LLLSKKLFPVAFTVFCLHLNEKEPVSTTFFEKENFDTVVKRRHIVVLISGKIPVSLTFHYQDFFSSWSGALAASSNM
jgi:hypothetical protein